MAGATAAEGAGVTATPSADERPPQQSPAAAVGGAAARRNTQQGPGRYTRRQQQQPEGSEPGVEYDEQAYDSDAGNYSPLERSTGRPQPPVSAAAAAAYTGPFQQVLGSKQQPEQPTQAWPSAAARHGSSDSEAY
jgi:hypothetical protein